MAGTWVEGDTAEVGGMEDPSRIPTVKESDKAGERFWDWTAGVLFLQGRGVCHL